MEAGDAIGKRNFGLCIVDGHVPFIAGDVPIEFVVIGEELHGFLHAVVKDDRARGVHRVGNVNLVFQVLRLAAGFVAERGAGIIGDAHHVEVERVIEAVVIVLDGNGAVEAVPRALEVREDRFSDIHGAIGKDGDFGFEILDGKGARFGGQRIQEKRQREKNKGGAREEPRSGRHGKGGPANYEARGRSETDLGNFAFRGSADLEELAQLEIEHAGDDVRGERRIFVFRSRTTAL